MSIKVLDSSFINNRQLGNFSNSLQIWKLIQLSLYFLFLNSVTTSVLYRNVKTIVQHKKKTTFGYLFYLKHFMVYVLKARL